LTDKIKKEQPKKTPLFDLFFEQNLPTFFRTSANPTKRPTKAHDSSRSSASFRDEFPGPLTPRPVSAPRPYFSVAASISQLDLLQKKL
jgi:hypothetical protein